MSSCTSSPTLTRTNEITTESLSTLTSTRTQTLPPTTTTITLTPSCTIVSCTPTPVTSTSEIPGGTTTILDTITSTIPITSTQVTTLWGTSCTRTAGDASQTSNPPDNNTDTSTSTTSTPTTMSTPSPPASTTTSSPVFSTPPPSIIVTSSSSTQADGNVTPVILTITSTQAPVLITDTPGLAGDPSDNTDTSKHLGPIIGGVVGGVVALALIFLLGWFFIRRRRRWDDIFEVEDDLGAARRKEKSEAEPSRPYQYGLVGHTKSPSLTTPSTPPFTSITMGSDMGYDSVHQRHNSTTPLLGPPMSAMSLGSGIPSPRPPSTVGSLQGFAPPLQDNTLISIQDTNNQQQQNQWDPNLLYNFPQQPSVPAASPSASTTGFNLSPLGAITVPTTSMMARTSSDIEPRTGSPISYQEPRILQVTNGGPELGSPPAPSSPLRDGKGRPITRGEKVPLVHLDGGRYQQPTAGSSTSAPAPPAYQE